MGNRQADDERNANGAEPVYGPAYTGQSAARPLGNGYRPGTGQVVAAEAFDGPSPPYTAPYPPYPSDVPDTIPLPANVAAALAYLLVPAVFFLLVAPYRSQAFLRFHSWQAIFYFIAGVAAREVEQVLVSMLPSSIAFLIGGLLGLLLVTGWMVAVVKALQGDRCLLPFVGRFAEQTSRTSSMRD